MILVIDRRDASLEVSGHCLIVRTPNVKNRNVGLSQIESVLLVGNVSLNTRTLLKLLDAGIGVQLIPARRSQACQPFVAESHGNQLRRWRQIHWLGDERQTGRWARWLMHIRRRQMIKLLLEAQRRRPDLRRVWHESIHRLKNMALSEDHGTLLGQEGAMTRGYFAAYRHLFAPSWHFSSRNRRPPRDPVNALLSFSYSMLHGIALRELIRQGLDPAFGFYHRISYGRNSLACDMQELGRWHCERWVWQITAEQVLTPSHFATTSEGCFLTKSGRGRYFSHWPELRKKLVAECRYWATRWRRYVDQANETTDLDSPGTERAAGLA